MDVCACVIERAQEDRGQAVLVRVYVLWGRSTGGMSVELAVA